MEAGKTEGLKSGVKTSEFWVTMLLMIGGVVLIALGKDSLGAALMGASGTGYTLSRGHAKKGGAA